MNVSIRLAEMSDVPAITAIYNEAVINTTASYDYEPASLENRTQWFEQHRQLGLPVMVAVDETGAIVGFGALSKFRDKIGYQYTVEHSVYVEKNHYRQGIGRLIVLTLIDAACALGKHIIIGGVDGSNEASVRLHEALGFEKVAHFKQVGYKFDRWLDVIFFQRVLER